MHLLFQTLLSSIVMLGLLGCPQEPPPPGGDDQEKVKDDQEQEVVTLDAGGSENPPPVADAGSVVPPETSDAGTPTPSPSDAGSNAPQGQWWLDAGLIFGCMTDADCTALNGQGTCSADTEGGYNVEVFTGRCKIYEGGTSESTFSYCKLQTEIENCGDCSCGETSELTDAGQDPASAYIQALIEAFDAGWVPDGGNYLIPPYTTEASYPDGGHPYMLDSDAGPSNTMGAFALNQGITCGAGFFGCKDPNQPPGTCCQTGLESCYHINTSVFGKKIRVAKCSPKKKEACYAYGTQQQKDDWKVCHGSKTNICCTKDQTCRVSSGFPVAGHAYCSYENPQVPGQNSCPANTTKCMNKDGNHILDCCPAGSTCKDIGGGFRACSHSIDSCKLPDRICIGKFNRCCEAGTQCVSGTIHGNANCIPKQFTDCKPMTSYISPTTGQCVCEPLCAQDPEYQVCGGDGCGGSCGTCDEGSSCAEDSTGGICLPDEEETPDAGTPDPEPEPTVDAGTGGSDGCADGCPDYGLECSDVDGMPGMQTVFYQKGECQDDGMPGMAPYCFYVPQMCTTDQCAYGVCDGAMIDVFE